jgi:hypothetical protein
MINITTIEDTQSPTLPPSTPAENATPSASPVVVPEKKPYSLHFPLVVSTTEPVMLHGDPQSLLAQILDRLKFNVRVVTPDDQVVPMYASTIVAEKSDTDVTIPVVLCCRLRPDAKVNDLDKFAEGLIGTLNEAISKYGCALSHIQPHIADAALPSMEVPI